MSRSQDRSHSTDRSYGLLGDCDQILFERLYRQNTQYEPMDAPLSLPYQDMDLFETLSSHELHLKGDLGREEVLGESLEGLVLDENNGLSNSELPYSTFGRPDNIGMDADRSPHVPETIDPSIDSGCHRIYRAHTLHTPPRISNSAESSSPWRQSALCSDRSSANLRPCPYTPHRSTTANCSQHSDSGWESIPSTPFADEDSRPIPDNNSASIQSYNDPQSGIWFPRSSYEPYFPTMEMSNDNSIDPTMTSLLQQKLQEVFAKADAATPFGAESRSSEGAPFVNAVLGPDQRVGMADPSLPSPSADGDPAPPNSQSPPYGRSEFSILVNGTMDSAAFPSRRPPKVGHLFLSPGICQRILPSLAPRAILGNTSLPETNSPPGMLMDPAASAPSPLASADASTDDVSSCTRCQAKFTGRTRKDTLRRHELIVHKNVVKPTCPECHLVIQSGRRDNLKRHIRKQHPGHPSLASLNVRGRKASGKRKVTMRGTKAKLPCQPA